MASVQLLGYHVEGVEFVNKINGTKKIELGNKVSYNVRYSQTNICRGTIIAETSDKNAPGDFCVKVTLSGDFRIDPEKTKEELHLITYDALFPYVKTYISMITSAGGIPPVMIPYIDISNKEIYRFDMPAKKHGDETEE